MKRTSILVSFNINDLQASYEAVVSSKDYSFTKNFGKGSDLVSLVGHNFSQNISLEGNYGNFQVRIYAISSIGVRSDYISENVTVVPPEFYGTFQFSELVNNVGANVSNASNSYTIINSPEDFSSGNSLEISDGVYDKNVSLSWSLNPPFGHVLHGQNLTDALLGDTFFDHFKIKIIKSGNEIDLSFFDENGAEISALANSLSVSNSSVIDKLNNYKEFNLNLSDEVFNALNLGRSFSVEIQAFDSKGNDCSASIDFSSTPPVINSLTNNIVGNKSTLTWDYSGITVGKSNSIRVISMPLSSYLKDSEDFEENFSFFSLVANAKKYKNISGNTYAVGDVVSYNGYVYECISQHSSSSSTRPGNNSIWTQIGPEGVYNVSQQTSSSNSYEQFQDWGYKYYYSLTPSDIIGEGDSVEYRIAGDLAASSSSVSIQNGLAYEDRGDIVFSWDIQDNNGNDVDLDQYRFSSNPNFPPAILGISGHLFDLDMWRNYSKEVIIKQLNDGRNSVSTNADGELSAAPSVGVYDRYEYNISENRNIYTSRGFPAYEVFNYEKIYNQGQYVIVLDQEGLYYAARDTLNSDSNGKSIYVKPYYSEFNIEDNYKSGDCIVENNSIYELKQDFGIDSSKGVFRYDSNYDVGDYVIASNNFVQKFDAAKGYEVDEIVTFEGNFYICITAQLIYAEDINNRNYWALLSEFDEIECSLYVATNAVSSNANYPSQDSVNWQKIQLNNENYFSLIIEPYPMQGFSDWSSSVVYEEGDVVVYKNDTWVCASRNSGQKPGRRKMYWSNSAPDGVDLVEGFGYKEGDLVYANGSVYECLRDNPLCAPLRLENTDARSSYSQVGWKPFWVQDETYNDVVFGHMAIPEGGKRGVGLSLSILDINEEPISSVRITGVNPAPVISNQDFEIDSISVTERVKFNFKYLLGFQERTTFLELYRKPAQDWIDDDYTFEIRDKKNFVKRVEANVDDAYGENIVEIEDFPPIEVDSNGKKIAAGYVYKLLPYDDFGSGQQHFVSSDNGDKIISVFPKNLSNQEEGAPNGPVIRASQGIANLGAVPFPVDNLSGSTAFETFLLNWETRDNDIDFFELWQEKSDSNEGALIIQEGESTPEFLSQEKNQEGFRRFAGALYSIGDTVPTEQTEFSVINAEKIFDIPGNTRTVSTSVAGDANSSANFWVRAVDKGGNKSPFTGSFLGDSSSNILGLSLTAGGFDPQSIDGFESSITEKFPKSIALVPDNPFIAGDRNAWSSHKLFWRGGEYNISEYDNTDFSAEYSEGYVYWRTGDNAYGFSESHPANNSDLEFEDGDFIVARYSKDEEGALHVSTQFVAYNTASIGTANIVDGAITNAKIGSLSADKITAGLINSQDIQIGGTGAIRSVGFNGSETDSGFTLNGDGEFIFQKVIGNQVSKIFFGEEGLVIQGKLKSTSGKTTEIIRGSASTESLKYYPITEPIHHPDGYNSIIMEDELTFYPFWHEKITDTTTEYAKATAPTIEFTFRIQNSTLRPEDIRFNVFAVKDGDTVQIVGDEHHGGHGYDIYGFKFDLNNNSGDDIVIDEDSMIVKCTLDGGYVKDHDVWSKALAPQYYPHSYGFDYMIKFAFTSDLPGGWLYDNGLEGKYFAEDQIADGVLVQYTSISGSGTEQVIVRRTADAVAGPQGQQGETGASVDFWFTRSHSLPSFVDSGENPGDEWYTDFSKLSDTIKAFSTINPKTGELINSNYIKWLEGNSNIQVNLSDIGFNYYEIPDVLNPKLEDSWGQSPGEVVINSVVQSSNGDIVITFATANGGPVYGMGYLQFDLIAKGSLYSLKAQSTGNTDEFNFSNLQQIEGDAIAEIAVHRVYNEGEFDGLPIDVQKVLRAITFNFRENKLNLNEDGKLYDASGSFSEFSNSDKAALEAELEEWTTDQPSLNPGQELRSALLLFAGSKVDSKSTPLNPDPISIDIRQTREILTIQEIFFKASPTKPSDEHATPNTSPEGGGLNVPEDNYQNNGWYNSIDSLTNTLNYPADGNKHIWQIRGSISDGGSNAEEWQFDDTITKLSSQESIEVKVFYTQDLGGSPMDTTELGNKINALDNIDELTLNNDTWTLTGFDTLRQNDDNWYFDLNPTSVNTKYSRTYMSTVVFSKPNLDSNTYYRVGDWSPLSLFVSDGRYILPEVTVRTINDDQDAEVIQDVLRIPTDENNNNLYDHDILPITLKIPKGKRGPGTTFRGKFLDSNGKVKEKPYVGGPDDPIRDVVEHNGSYYVCIQSYNATESSKTPDEDTNYWQSIPHFESISTGLLLAERSFVTDKLEIGDEDDDGGLIKSVGFRGGLITTESQMDWIGYYSLAKGYNLSLLDGTKNVYSENYNTPGFLLANIRIADSSNLPENGEMHSFFDVGGPDQINKLLVDSGKSDPGNSSYIRYSSMTGKIELAGSFINNSTLNETAVFEAADDGQLIDSNWVLDEYGSFIGGGYNNELSGDTGEMYILNIPGNLCDSMMTSGGRNVYDYGFEPYEQWKLNHWQWAPVSRVWLRNSDGTYGRRFTKDDIFYNNIIITKEEYDALSYSTGFSWYSGWGSDGWRVYFGKEHFIQWVNGRPAFVNTGSSIVAGAGNEIKGRFSTISGGYKSLCKDNFSFIGAGYKNEMSVDESELIYHSVGIPPYEYDKSFTQIRTVYEYSRAYAQDLAYLDYYDNVSFEAISAETFSSGYFTYFYKPAYFEGDPDGESHVWTGSWSSIYRTAAQWIWGKYFNVSNPAGAQNSKEQYQNYPRGNVYLFKTLDDPMLDDTSDDFKFVDSNQYPDLQLIHGTEVYQLSPQGDEYYDESTLISSFLDRCLQPGRRAELIQDMGGGIENMYFTIREVYSQGDSDTWYYYTTQMGKAVSSAYLIPLQKIGDTYSVRKVNGKTKRYQLESHSELKSRGYRVRDGHSRFKAYEDYTSGKTLKEITVNQDFGKFRLPYEEIYTNQSYITRQLELGTLTLEQEDFEKLPKYTSLDYWGNLYLGRDFFEIRDFGYGLSGSHQGVNFMGSGINNKIEGGSNQTILNGNNNKIESKVGIFAPKFDNLNSWTNKNILGTYDSDNIVSNGKFESFFGRLDVADFQAGVPTNRVVSNLNLSAWVRLDYIGDKNYSIFSFDPETRISKIEDEHGLNDPNSENYLEGRWVYLARDYDFLYLDKPIKSMWVYLSDISSVGKNPTHEGWCIIYRNNSYNARKNITFAYTK
jgi:hypothetical protein